MLLIQLSKYHKGGPWTSCSSVYLKNVAWCLWHCRLSLNLLNKLWGTDESISNFFFIFFFHFSSCNVERRMRWDHIGKNQAEWKLFCQDWNNDHLLLFQPRNLVHISSNRQSLNLIVLARSSLIFEILFPYNLITQGDDIFY